MSVDAFSELCICVRTDGLTGLTPGARPCALSELAFTAEGDVRFIATCTTARIASASATLAHAIRLETRPSFRLDSVPRILPPLLALPLLATGVTEIYWEIATVCGIRLVSRSRDRWRAWRAAGSEVTDCSSSINAIH